MPLSSAVGQSGKAQCSGAALVADAAATGRMPLGLQGVVSKALLAASQGRDQRAPLGAPVVWVGIWHLPSVEDAIRVRLCWHGRGGFRLLRRQLRGEDNIPAFALRVVHLCSCFCQWSAGLCSLWGGRMSSLHGPLTVRHSAHYASCMGRSQAGSLFVSSTLCCVEGFLQTRNRNDSSVGGIVAVLQWLRPSLRVFLFLQCLECW